MCGEDYGRPNCPAIRQKSFFNWSIALVILPALLNRNPAPHDAKVIDHPPDTARWHTGSAEHLADETREGAGDVGIVARGVGDVGRRLGRGVDVAVGD